MMPSGWWLIPSVILGTADWVALVAAIVAALT